MDNNGDMYCPASGQSINLTQHRSDATRMKEYWRHNDSSNVLYFDGHVKTMVRKESIPTSFYSIP